MKITRSEFNVISHRASTHQDPTAPRATANPTKPQEALVSQEARLLEQTAGLLNDTSDIDLAKVAELRTAIAEGKLPLDLDALAEAMLDMHRK